MKLFEDMKELGGSINDVIQQMINDMFREELDDDEITEIVNKLSLSDLLALDVAYTNGDKEAVQDIIGPLPQFEYSMGAGRQVSSSASSRPAPKASGSQAGAKKPGAGDSTKTTRNYSGGVQNGVSTTNVDSEDDATVDNPDATMQDQEIEEAGLGTGLKAFSKRGQNADPRIIKMKLMLTGPDWIKRIANSPEGKTSFGDKVAAKLFRALGLPKEGELQQRIAKKLVASGDYKKAITVNYGTMAYTDDEIRDMYQRYIINGEDPRDDLTLDNVYPKVKFAMSRIAPGVKLNGIGWTKDRNIAIKTMSGKTYEYDPIANKILNNSQEIEEAGAPDYNPARGGYGSSDDEAFNSHEVIRALEGAAEDEPELHALQLLAHRIYQSHPDDITIAQIMNMLNEPNLRSVGKEDVEYALQAAGIMDFMEGEVDESVEDPDNFYSVGDILGFLHTWYDKRKIDADVLNQLKQTTRAMSKNGEVQIDKFLDKLGQKGFDTNKFRQGLDHFVDKNSHYSESVEETNIVTMTEWLQRRAGIK